jgi:uncharacterized repeat protein (TIGR03803 family)
MPVNQVTCGAGNKHQHCEWKAAGAIAILLIAVSVCPAQTFETLYNFANGSDGSYPVGPLIQGLNGNFYGATNGTTSGTIFDVNAQGTLTTQAILPGNSGSANLALGSDGNYYGTEPTGGGEFSGTLFQLASGGQFSVLYTFSGGTDGYWPSSLVLGTNGILYGTTFGGGNFGCNAPHGCGTVFEVLNRTVITRYSFGTKDAGISPEGGLALGPDGNLYGTTSAPQPGTSGGGTVFRITPTGKLTTLYRFCLQSGCPDGNSPSSLTLGADGNFYGTTQFGGDNTCRTGGCGTVFKITPGGTLTTLYAFPGGWPLGVGPSAVIQATDTNLYGATFQGGDSTCGQGNGCGTLFKISRSGTFTLLHTFELSDGENPGALLQGTNGILYGATAVGGLNNYGTLLTLSLRVRSFVETVPTAGKVAANVIILGNNLTGTSSVSFNGTAAVFQVISSTEISATVPTGATSGKVTVTTPSGSLVSNTRFYVTH